MPQDYGASDGRQVGGPCNQFTTTSGDVLDLCLEDDCWTINEQAICAFNRPLSDVREREKEEAFVLFESLLTRFDAPDQESFCIRRPAASMSLQQLERDL